MPDLRSLLEREMDDIRPPGYTIDDIAHRRDRRRRNQRLGTAVVVLAIAFIPIWVIVQTIAHAPSAVPADHPSVTPSVPTRRGVLELTESNCPDYSCEGPLGLGRYRATYYDPTTISFEISSPGWRWSYTGNFVIESGGTSSPRGPEPDGIYFLLDPAIASQDRVCSESGEPGVRRSARDLAAWLEAAPGLAVSQSKGVTVGGLDGVQLDLEVAQTWERPCQFSDGVPTVPLVYSDADPGGYYWPISAGHSMRWYILDSPEGVIIVDIEDNEGGLSRDDLFQNADRIVNTMDFRPRS
jgi:hypothetical protein